jgi:RNA polymerase sigma-70 factor, ECF subfamily
VRNAVVDSGSKKLEGLLEQIAAAKDPKAFAELYSVTKRKLFSTVLMIVRRSDLAEEIVQDVYVRIWSHASSYSAALSSPMNWMISIARHMAIDHARKKVHETSTDDSILLKLPSEGPTAIEIIEAREDDRHAAEQRQRVFSALQALNPVRRDLVVRAYLHGESREQLSRSAGVPVNTVKTWIRRALLEVEAILRNTERDTGIAPGNLTANRQEIASGRSGRRPWHNGLIAPSDATSQTTC